jgi:hypothetical protein
VRSVWTSARDRADSASRPIGSRRCGIRVVTARQGLAEDRQAAFGVGETVETHVEDLAPGDDLPDRGRSARIVRVRLVGGEQALQVSGGEHHDHRHEARDHLAEVHGLVLEQAPESVDDGRGMLAAHALAVEGEQTSRALLR